MFKAKSAILTKIITRVQHHVKLHIFTMAIMVLCPYVPVDGIALGLYLYQHKDHSASVNITRSGDSEDVELVKSFLSAMIAKDPVVRPSIQEVVDNFTYLLTTLRAQQLHATDFFKSKGNYPVLELIFRLSLSLSLSLSVSLSLSNLLFHIILQLTMNEA